MRPTVLYFAELCATIPRRPGPTRRQRAKALAQPRLSRAALLIESARCDILLYAGRYAEVGPHVAGEWLRFDDEAGRAVQRAGPASSPPASPGTRRPGNRQLG